MNRENATKWVAALRSGDYEQGRSALNYNGRYCCLGVACEVAIEAGVAVRRQEFWNGEVRYDNENSALPRRVREWLSAEADDPLLNGHAAIHRNDPLGQSFEEIAQAIEVEAGLV